MTRFQCELVEVDPGRGRLHLRLADLFWSPSEPLVRRAIADGWIRLRSGRRVTVRRDRLGELYRAHGRASLLEHDEAGRLAWQPREADRPLFL